MSNIMGLLLEDYKERGRKEGKVQGIVQGIEQGIEQGTITGTLLTLSKYGKLKEEELIKETIAICGKDHSFVKSIYEELLQKGELK